MPLIDWTSTQDATLAQLQAQRDAALADLNADITQTVNAAALDNSFSTVVCQFLQNNGQAVFDMLFRHYTVTPPAVTDEGAAP